jgi:leader peptidase (prepilin peptidase) / N-methyltransferase
MVYLLLGALGLAWGSFVNAFVWRLHVQNLKTAKEKRKELSIINGRSMCPECKHTLAAIDLIPVLSWLLLRGKCRYCKNPISIQYPLVELLTAVLFVVSYIIWPYGFEAEGMVLFGAWLVLLVGLIALVVYDIRWMLLPNKVVYPLFVFWAAVVLLRIFVYQSGIELLWGALTGLLICGGLFWILFQISDGKWIGGGDVKLGFLLGLVVAGAMPAFSVIFLASLLGTIWVLPFLLNKKLGIKAQVPFGPFLIAATIIIFLIGDRLLGALTGYFLLV